MEEIDSKWRKEKDTEVRSKEKKKYLFACFGYDIRGP